MGKPPMVASSRPDNSGLFRDTFALYRRCVRPLLALGGVSAIVAGGTGLAVLWLYATPVLTALVSFNPAGLASEALLAAAACGLASMLVTVQCGAVVAQVASQVADGRMPDLPAAWRATTTVVPRLLLPCLVLSAGTLLVTATGITVVLNALRSARLSVTADRTAAVSTIFTIFGAVAVGVLAAVAVSWWLRVKLFLVLPAASLEKLPGFAPVKKSWQLTRRVAGPVFGALLLVAMAEGAAVGLGAQVAGALMPPSPTGGDFSGLVSLVSQQMPSITVATAAWAAAATLTGPFLTVMSTLVHRALTGYRLTPLMSG